MLSKEPLYICQGPFLSKKIQRAIQVYFLPDLELIFWLCHVVQNKFKDNGTAKASSLYLEIGKATWHIYIMNRIYIYKAGILHSIRESVSSARGW